MDDETQRHIFEKFYQGDTAHASSGNGLGLSIVKRIVDLCEGSITVKSCLGFGTEVTVELPVS
jgi:signal transduction histidine kinase